MPSGQMWIGNMCAHLSHPVAFKQPLFRLPDTMFPPSASSCRVPPAVSTVGDFFRSGMGAVSAGNDSKARKALPARYLICRRIKTAALMDALRGSR